MNNDPLRNWRDAEKEERLEMMRNIHATSLETRRSFNSVLWDPELRKNWAEVLNVIAHDGARDANNLKLYIDKEEIGTGWYALHRTYWWIRLMNMILELHEKGKS